MARWVATFTPGARRGRAPRSPRRSLYAALVKAEAEEHREQRQRIIGLIDAAGLSARRDELTAILRPAIGLRTRPLDDVARAPGATRVGGEPDLPPAASWPEGEEGPLLFVLQVDLASVAPLDLEGRLPPHGLLSVFADRFARDVRVLHTPAGAELVRHPWLPVLRPAFTACGVEARGELHVPPPASAFVAPADARLVLTSDEHDAYWDGVWLPWREVLRPGPAGSCGIHQLLGYAAAEQLEEQALDEDVLVGFDSDDRAGMEWGDVHCVWLLMARAALEARAWHELRVAM